MERVEHDQWKSSEVARLLSLVEVERRYYQDIFAVLPVAVAVVDETWGLTAFNREFRRLLGVNQADLAGMHLLDLIPDPDLEAALERALEPGVARTSCVVRIGEAGGGRELRIEMQAAPGWHAGTGADLLLTLQEVTVAAEAPAPPGIPSTVIEQHKRGAVERLSGRVAHVANNLLMIIGGYAEELDASLAPGDPRHGEIGEILKASGRLATLTHSLNSLTRPPAVQAEDFEAGAWAEAMAARLGIGVRVESERPLVVSGSAGLLEEAFRTAHRYLAPYVGDGGMVLTAREGVGEAVDLALSLDGAELPPDAAECIFEPFSGAKEGADPPLGLAGLLRPLEQLGCSMRLLGNTTLLIRCPRGTAVAPPRPAGRVLLLEDEPGIRSLMLRALEREGFLVTQASSTPDALAACELDSQRPDLLITDIRMPEVQGPALAAAIRAEHPEIKVLFVSGSTGDEELDRLIGQEELPAGTSFLAKPFSVSALLAEVRALIEGGN